MADQVGRPVCASVTEQRAVETTANVGQLQAFAELLKEPRDAGLPHGQHRVINSACTQRRRRWLRPRSLAEGAVAEQLCQFGEQLQVVFSGCSGTSGTKSRLTGLPSGASKGIGVLRRMTAPVA